jgi:hypothetical protein
MAVQVASQEMRILVTDARWTPSGEESTPMEIMRSDNHYVASVIKGLQTDCWRLETGIPRRTLAS